MPCVNNPANGSSIPTSPHLRIARVKKREESRCKMACSIPPMYWSTGSHSSTVLRSVGAVLIQGSVKRAKYQDESTNVSMVSVSRRAGPAHFGHFTFFQVG